MSIQRWSEDVILVELPGEWTKHNELQTVADMLRAGSEYDVVIDFSDADVVGAACLAGLLEIQRLVNEGGHRLTLCKVAPATRGVFTVARLEDLFEFAEDRFTALASPQMVG
jgi:anti-anti-sigma factor